MTVNALDGGILARTVSWLRWMDPSGVYLRFTLFVSALAALSGLGAYISARAVAGTAEASTAALLAGLCCGLAVTFARPDSRNRRLRAAAIMAGGLGAGALLSLALSPWPAIVHAVLVVVAFAGFYARRWPDPAPSAGLLGTSMYLVVQILLPEANRTVLLVGVPYALLGVVAGYCCLPSELFHRGFLTMVRHLRAGVTDALGDNTGSAEGLRASVGRVDALFAAVQAARAQADQFDPARSDLRLAIVKEAAILARVWENAADALRTATAVPTSLPPEVTSALRAGTAAVHDALRRPMPGTRRFATETLAGLDEHIGAALAEPPGRRRDSTGLTVFAVLNCELTLTHLLSAAQALDETLRIPGETPGMPGEARP